MSDKQLLDMLKREKELHALTTEALNAARKEVYRLRDENSRFGQALFGANVTKPRDDLMASQGPKQSAYDDKI